ncbi:putative T7SS-secreted protein [Saccharopolyspora gregorii]|uniref:putative T7SS-secreted protein n=1 Tax=Saccharopolyspora gregorii TaxID=33914 RepID=UPI0021AC18A2|nr:GH-E family nuclease [Saccharopolyspora gregorii]
MAAELGQARDPKALIPGDPDALNGTVEKFTIFGAALIAAGEGMRDITVSGWSGSAADKFLALYQVEPLRWLTCGDAFNDAASALITYSDALRWAQGKAADAVAMWDEAQASTDAARAEHARALDHVAREAAARGVPAGPQPPFEDPGAEQRAAAIDLLNRARTDLHSAGDLAASAIAAARDHAPDKPGWFGQMLGMVEDFAYDMRDGANESLDATLSFAASLAQDPGKIDDAASAAATNIASAVTNPGQTVKNILDVDTWKDSPGRAVGHLIADTVGGGPVKRVAGEVAAGRALAGDGARRDERRGYEPVRNRVKLRAQTKRDIYRSADRAPNGEDFECAATEEEIPARRYPDGSPVLINPDTGKPDRNGMSVPQPGEFHFGHQPYREWWRYKIEAEEGGYSRQRVIEDQNDPDRYRIETPQANRSHRYEHPR